MIGLGGAKILFLILVLAITGVVVLLHVARDTRKKGNW